ncbi:MAG TPA: hypothetical protein VFS60_07280 [Thermoanaerobaculia bacterium]|nr:hypothetical protein [Thermoanaerobaculia bacterium]
MKSDELTAEAQGNAIRDPSRPFGDTPLGTYRVEGYQACPPGDSEERGPNDRIKLTPLSGDAMTAAGNGRVGYQIHGGRIGPLGRLRPTCGSIRLSDAAMGDLLRAIGHRGLFNLPETCEIRAGSGLPEGLAADAGLEGDDPSPDLARPTTSAPGQPAPPPFIASFGVTPSSIPAGASVGLLWHTVFASDVTIDGQHLPTSGSVSRQPSSDTTFELVASGVGPPARGVVRVTVRIPIPPPPPPPPRPPHDREPHDRFHDRI